jgi:hypothetical protein
MIIVSALMLPVMIVRFYMGWFEMLTIDLPLIIASFWSISAFYLVAQRELHPKTWKRTILFLPILMAVGVGLTQVAMKLLPKILRSDLPFRVKAEAFFHLTPNISYPLMIVVSALMLPVMIVRFYMGWFEMVLIDFPLIVASFWSISAFYVIAHRALFPKTWKRAFLFLPALMAAGVALTIINSRSVFEALIGYQTAFARTPKYGSQQVERMANIRYRRRSGWLPYAELVVGSIFLAIVVFAIDSMNYLAVPFLLLFVGGYYWAGFTTLWQEYQGKLAFERQRELAAEQAEA